jgi:5-hydroxyisourate hydrolase-like protein (transthyretin family)
MPANEAVKFVYAPGSRSGYTPDTVFDYIVTNRVNADGFEEGSLDASALENGAYTLRVFAADYFGNVTDDDIQFEVAK